MIQFMNTWIMEENPEFAQAAKRYESIKDAPAGRSLPNHIESWQVSECVIARAFTPDEPIKVKGVSEKLPLNIQEFQSMDRKTAIAKSDPALPFMATAFRYRTEAGLAVARADWRYFKRLSEALKAQQNGDLVSEDLQILRFIFEAYLWLRRKAALKRLASRE